MLKQSFPWLNDAALYRNINPFDLVPSSTITLKTNMN